VANGQFEVQLKAMGVPAEDIMAYRRIEARLAEAAARARQVAQAAHPSTSHMQTRSKGTAPDGAKAEAMNQYRRCKKMDALSATATADTREEEDAGTCLLSRR
jgi:hypothetical protein